MAGRRRRCPTRACSEPCSAAALFPTAIAVMGVAFGALMRHTATAIGILVAMLVRRAGAVRDAGRGVGRRRLEYLPGEAGQAMITVVKDPGRDVTAAGSARADRLGRCPARRCHDRPQAPRRLRRHRRDLRPDPLPTGRVDGASPKRYWQGDDPVRSRASIARGQRPMLSSSTWRSPPPSVVVPWSSKRPTLVTSAPASMPSMSRACAGAFGADPAAPPCPAAGAGGRRDRRRVVADPRRRPDRAPGRSVPRPVHGGVDVRPQRSPGPPARWPQLRCT